MTPKNERNAGRPALPDARVIYIKLTGRQFAWYQSHGNKKGAILRGLIDSAIAEQSDLLSK